MQSDCAVKGRVVEATNTNSDLELESLLSAASLAQHAKQHAGTPAAVTMTQPDEGAIQKSSMKP